jgi:hypothetical protein
MPCIDGGNARDLLLFNDLGNAVERSLDGAYAPAREALSDSRRTLDALPRSSERRTIWSSNSR